MFNEYQTALSLERNDMISYFVQKPAGGKLPDFINSRSIGEVRKFHRSVAGYAPTPLVCLDGFAADLGVARVLVKDESLRFGLNAFKALGGIYAVARVAFGIAGLPADASMSDLLRPEVRDRISDVTFVTATDGNHGRGVAWAANMIGCRSVVYMPKGSSQSRFDAIGEFGAHVEILDMNYDEAVRYASEQAGQHGWIVIQDTAWEGYEEIPGFITLGYMTMADEAFDEIRRRGLPDVTHVFIQAGVGSMAGGVLGYMVERFGDRHPKAIVMEADAADCIYRSMLIGDGRPHAVTGDLTTIMAGLACGEANKTTFGILRDHASAFLSCDDEVARLGMRLLAYPKEGDQAVVSGESGAVGAGVLELVMKEEKYDMLKNELALDKDSVVLLFSTEGDTDPESYDSIVGRNK